MKKIKIYDYKSGKNEHHILTAEINDKGDLILAGYDCGESVKNFFGDFDHEYWLTVKKKNVPEVLLHLIKERFETDLEFKDWFKEKEIPYDFSSYT